MNKKIHWAGIWTLVCLVMSCNNAEKYDVKEGKELAHKYCASCHQFPEPSLLNKYTWREGVLPVMARKMGVSSTRAEGEPLPFVVRPADAIALDDWRKIIAYYEKEAPDSLYYNRDDEPIEMDTVTFEPVHLSISNPKTRMGYVGVDTAAKGGVRAYSNSTTTFYRFNKALTVTDSFRSGQVVVAMNGNQDEMAVCDMGVIMPHDNPFGSISFWRFNDGRYTAKPLIRGLRRPVSMERADMNADGREDLLVCEFGNTIGSLTLFMDSLGKGYSRRSLKGIPGAIRTAIRDVNKDGLPDVYALFAQGDEGLSLFINQGNGKFEEQRILRFPSVFGSSYFELADINADGLEDIIYTCGDNADYSAIYKPYHGVYLYLNNGKGGFEQKFFFHVNGCYKAMAADFDHDGRKDIAVISFFADYERRPEEGFFWLKQTAPLKFNAFTLPAAKEGRWLTMDTGDVDGDGKTDIVLGSFSAPGFSKSMHGFDNAPPVLVLKNRSSK